ncbi:MAG: hypothetical protein WC750_01195 [Patescibacteria group bacterium]|jgi:hypothetical protein
MTNQACLIIFNPELLPLGEMALEGSACDQINLSQEGETLLGAHIAEWQTQGLACQRPSLIKTNEGTGCAFCNEQIKMNSQDFAQAFRSWLEDHGFSHLTLPLGAMVAFSEIQRMAIDPQKKYELALMLRDLPVHKLAG